MDSLSAQIRNGPPLGLAQTTRLGARYPRPSSASTRALRERGAVGSLARNRSVQAFLESEIPSAAAAQQRPFTSAGAFIIYVYTQAVAGDDLPSRRCIRAPLPLPCGARGWLNENSPPRLLGTAPALSLSLALARAAYTYTASERGTAAFGPRRQKCTLLPRRPLRIPQHCRVQRERRAKIPRRERR